MWRRSSHPILLRVRLLRSWPRLREAIRQARDALQSGIRFRLALEEWLEHERADDYLLEGVRLAEARQLASQQDIAFAARRAVEDGGTNQPGSAKCPRTLADS